MAVDFPLFVRAIKAVSAEDRMRFANNSSWLGSTLGSTGRTWPGKPSTVRRPRYASQDRWAADYCVELLLRRLSST